MVMRPWSGLTRPLSIFSKVLLLAGAVGAVQAQALSVDVECGLIPCEWSFL